MCTNLVVEECIYFCVGFGGGKALGPSKCIYLPS